MSGVLAGIRVIELAGLGPAPFCGMVLADLGAEVVRVDRADMVVGGHTPSTRNDLLNRGKLSVGINLKSEDGRKVVLDMAETAEGLIEGFRPGVAERLGVGPDDVLARNRALVYGRMTGWGQQGPWSGMAGHDIDYIALSGVLHAIGETSRPIPPLNLVGDFGGGGMVLALGVVSGILRARISGEGQVVDAAMVDGSAVLSSMQHGLIAEGTWTPERESNLLDGGAPFYTTYETADDRHVAVGALEPQFFAALVEGLGLDPAGLPDQSDRSRWPEMRARFAEKFLERARDDWDRHFEGTDACVAPVLSLTEAASHRHNRARSAYVEVDGVNQPGPAPRFSGTPSGPLRSPVAPGADTDRVLDSLGYTEKEIGMLRRSGAVA